MDTDALARAVHVVGVVLWIGGVGFVATVLLPSVRRLKLPSERLLFFTDFERRFAWQARGTTLIVGLSGLYMLTRFDLWDRFRSAGFWWMHAMVLVWLIFTLMLFVAEPLFLHRWLARRAVGDPERAFQFVERMHWLLLAVSLVTVLGAVAGAHGMMF